jgi:hypothetical protein
MAPSFLSPSRVSPGQGRLMNSHGRWPTCGRASPWMPVAPTAGAPFRGSDRWRHRLSTGCGLGCRLGLHPWLIIKRPLRGLHGTSRVGRVNRPDMSLPTTVGSVDPTLLGCLLERARCIVFLRHGERPGGHKVRPYERQQHPPTVPAACTSRSFDTLMAGKLRAGEHDVSCSYDGERPGGHKVRPYERQQHPPTVPAACNATTGGPCGRWRLAFGELVGRKKKNGGATPSSKSLPRGISSSFAAMP